MKKEQVLTQALLGGETQQTGTKQGGEAMRRLDYSYAVRSKKELPDFVKPMRSILHVRKKRSWDKWSELEVFDFGSKDEVLIVQDADFYRTPDPDEKYYFYFPAQDENGEEYWFYVEIKKSTAVKGVLSWTEAKEYIKEWIAGEIIKVEHITEKGEELLR